MSKKKDSVTDSDFSAPDGFQRISALEGVQLWYRPEPGDILSGMLLGRYKRRKPQQGESSPFYYQVRYEQPPNVPPIHVHKVGEDDDIICESGQVVNIQEWASMTDLAQLCADTANDYEVYIICRERAKLERGRTFWRFEVYAKPQKKV